METPSSIRMISRSPAASMNKRISVSAGKNDRWALVDITNASPIVGLASGTPSSLLKKRNHHHHHHPKQTPESGEALLRGQVKILLQKVEEEAEPHHHHHHSSGLGLAPTPTNTPNLPCEIVVNEESQEALVVFDESERCHVTRSLLFDDFLDDLSSCSSVFVAEDEQFQGGEEEESPSKMFVQKKPLSGCQGEEVTADDDDSSPAVSTRKEGD